MSFDNFENILSLLCTILGLLYCVFQYIETPRRGYRYLIVFFLANFLSEYYWTVYQLVMGAYPDVSGFAAYLGWNVGYFALLLAVYHMRADGAKRYFHPLMLLPLLVNIPQFHLYIKYGGVLNNLWEVGVTTVTMVFCLQEIIYYLKHRAAFRRPPAFSLIVLAYLAAKYGMWTASCFGWSSDLSNPYLYCAVIDAVLCVFFGYCAGRHYRADDEGAKGRSASELRFQVLMQTIASLVIVGICAAGFFAAFWIKRALSNGAGSFRSERQLVVCLFAISALLIALVLTLLYLLTSRYRHTLESIRRMNEEKRSRLNFVFTIGVTLALMVFAVVYNNVILYNSSVVSVYEDAEEAVKTTATELENYLTVAMTTLRVAADSVDLMEKNGRSIQEIEKYIVDQTTIQSGQFDENFTGIYACINGQFLDGLGWVPPEDYDPAARDWYRTTVEANGEVVIISPYVDAQTGSVVITIGKRVSDTDKGFGTMQNVVCLDVIVNHIKEVTQSVEIAGKGYGMVVNTDGFIIAHRNESFDGRNTADVYDASLLNSILGAKAGRTTARINGEDCTLFVAPVMNQWYSVIVIGNMELFEDTWSQLTINILVSLITFDTIGAWVQIEPAGHLPGRSI